MDADLDTLCTVVYCTADDLLPERQANARRRVTDAELVTLCVAQAIMGIPSDRRFLAVARQAPRSPVPRACPARPATTSAARRLADDDRVAHGRLRQPEPGLHGRPAAHRLDPGGVRPQPRDRQALGARPTPPTTATAPPTRASSGAFACTLSSLPTAPRGRSRWPSPSATSARSALELLERCQRAAARRSSATRATPAASSRARCRRARGHRRAPERAATSPAQGPTWRPSASASSRSSGPARTCSPWSATGRAPWPGLRERILQRFLCLAACISLNHQLGRPSRALVDYCA